MKRVMKVLGVILLVMIAGISVLVIKGFIESKKAALESDYYEAFTSSAPLEQKYSQLGTYAVANTEFPSENKAIQKYLFWYPAELEKTENQYPVIVVVNASGTPAHKYEAWFERLASWGFVVVGNEDPQTGTGETASLTLDYILHLPDNHILYNKLDTENIGIVGFSQGGAGALAAVTEYANGTVYKAIFTGSAAYPFLAENMGWHYDVSKIKIPYFMVAGTGKSDDRGVADPTQEFAGVSPLSAMLESYHLLPEDSFNVLARAVGAEHEDMLIRSDGYMTAWMLYQLTDDVEASQVFVGSNAEILHNSNWQEVEKNQ